MMIVIMNISNLEDSDSDCSFSSDTDDDSCGNPDTAGANPGSGPSVQGLHWSKLQQSSLAAETSPKDCINNHIFWTAFPEKRKAMQFVVTGVLVKRKRLCAFVKHVLANQVFIQ